MNEAVQESIKEVSITRYEIQIVSKQIIERV